ALSSMKSTNKRNTSELSIDALETPKAADKKMELFDEESETQNSTPRESISKEKIAPTQSSISFPAELDIPRVEEVKYVMKPVNSKLYLFPSGIRYPRSGGG
ncbi:hypothetical protein CYY_009793, partial [Polysphondylium violaceum]